MRVSFLGICLMLAIWMSSCSAFNDDDSRKGTEVTRIALVGSDEDAGGKDGILDYRYFYDNQGRVARVSIERNSPSVNQGFVSGISENYIYGYVAFDSISIMRQVLQYGAQDGALAENHAIRTSVGENGQFLWMEDSLDGIRMEYVYDAEARLSGLTKSWLRDSSQTQFHLEIGWNSNGNVESITAGSRIYRLGYGDAPLANTMNVDLLCWLVEREFMEGLPLWSIGLQGKANRNMPSALSLETGSERIRLMEFSYKTDGGGLITSFTKKDSRTGRSETYSIEAHTIE